MAIMKPKQKAGFAAGIYSDMTLDGPDIGTLVAVIDRAKNLPNRKAIGKQDPYCAMRLAKEAKKTNTDRRGGQTPKWDQELRFDVHDSPDYYKLKVSIFNDDKKTELIGESWIDLTSVIKLGGGQSDEWHQLNYKNKYAGDIRIELTYYDTREQPQEKKRRERSQPTPIDSDPEMLLLPAQRSLGPREIKRRPLPSSPAELAETIAVRTQPTPAQLSQAEPKSQSQLVHAPVPLHPRTGSASPLLDQAMTQQPVYDSDYAYSQIPDFDASHAQPHRNRHSQPRVEQERPWQQPLGLEHQQYHTQAVQHHREQYNEQQQYEDSPVPLPSAISQIIPDEQEMWLQNQQQRPRSVHFHSEPTTPQRSSPVYRPSPISTNSDTQLARQQQQHQYQHHHSSQSPYGTPFAQSPLKQTISQQELQSYPDDSDEPPPLPPKHKENTPKRSRSDYPPSAFLPQPLRIGQKRSSLSERSPLQTLEDGYELERYTQAEFVEQTHSRHNIYTQSPQQQPETPEQQVELYGGRSIYGGNPSSSGPQFQRQRPTSQTRRISYEIRHPSLSQPYVDEPQSMTPQDVYHSGVEDGYQPSVEDAPPSPGLFASVARKAVGAQAKRLNNIPFGPDSYDVLNPANSPVTNEGTTFQTAEQAKEAARYREVEKIRDLGPIIGNDGREIDPSDHLPSDTWAPEPERKNRPPEHVIHIRSRNDASKPSGARSAPIIIHTRGGSTPATPNSLVQSAQPISSPAARTTPSSFVGGRNRLQKAMPTPARALPVQPYTSPATIAATSSPALANTPQRTYSEDQPAPRPSSNRRPSHDNRVPAHMTRPPLTEYQVPVGNSYHPRHTSRDSYRSPANSTTQRSYDVTPTKRPQGNYSSPYIESERRSSYNTREKSYERRNSYDDRSDYSYENHVEAQRPREQPMPQQQRQYDDPLAAEMSLIDIGPSRNDHQHGSMSRSMVRRW